MDVCKTVAGRLTAMLLALALALASNGTAFIAVAEAEPLSVSSGAAQEDASPGEAPEEEAVPPSGEEDEPAGETPSAPSGDADGGTPSEGSGEPDGGAVPPAEVTPDGPEEDETPLPELEEGKAQIRFTNAEDARVSVAHAEGSASSVDVVEGEAFPFTATVPDDLRLEAAHVASLCYAEAADEDTAPAEMTFFQGDLPLPEPTVAEGVAAYELSIPAEVIHAFVEVTFETVPADAVSSWEEVLNAFTEGKNAKLVAEIELTQNSPAAVLSGGKEVILDLNGHSIKGTGKPSLESLFVVEDGSTLTFADSGGQADAPGDIAAQRANGTFGMTRTTEPVGTFSTVRDAGKRSEMNSSGDSLTYYTASSVSEYTGRTAETLQRNTITIEGKHVEGGIGSVYANGGIQALITATGGSTVNITGGLFENDGVKNGEGMTVRVTGSTLTMTGGLIWSSHAKDLAGAAVRAFAQSTVNVVGDAVMAGNKAETNGGAIYAEGSTVNLSGSAVLAGNEATSTAALSEEAMPTKGNGGAIYLTQRKASRGASLSIQGNVDIAGNAAQYNGGGIYGAEASVDVSMAGRGSQLYLSCNRTEWSPLGEGDPVYAQANLPTMGGGGILTFGALKLDGGFITGNLSSDGGGGVMFPTTTGYLEMTGSTVASNYAKSSEGGGLYCRTSGHDEKGKRKDKSTIYSGYITNNRTDTSFDYGGGGLFISNGSNDRGYLAVFDPIVTSNTAQGYGGGIAGCKNAVTISSSAAVFKNTAEEKNNTNNASIQLGDGYGKVIKEKFSQALGSAKHSSDIFSAKESTVYDRMLGGGSSHWSGYMSGSAADVKRNENDLREGVMYNGANEATLSGLKELGSVNHTFHNTFDHTLNTTVYQIPNGAFPQDVTGAKDPVARVHTKKVIALTANPSQADITKAYEAAQANLFITGNHSNVNGGGIAINGEGVVGHNPKTPEPTLGSLTITKTIDTSKEEFNPETGAITVVFDIQRFASKRAYDEGDEPLDTFERTLTFDESDLGQDGKLICKSIIFDNLKTDMFFVITERTGEGNFEFGSVGSNGINADTSSGPRAEVSIRVNADQALQDGKHFVKVSFTNTFKDKHVYAKSKVNRYTKDENGEYTWSEYVQVDPDEDIDYSESSTVPKEEEDPAPHVQG